jgi:hypothetical protein
MFLVWRGETFRVRLRGQLQLVRVHQLCHRVDVGVRALEPSKGRVEIIVRLSVLLGPARGELDLGNILVTAANADPVVAIRRGLDVSGRLDGGWAMAAQLAEAAVVTLHDVMLLGGRQIVRPDFVDLSASAGRADLAWIAFPIAYLRETATREDFSASRR